ncbi:hypothetical protein EVG20_g5086 [Dentipellis fragilis]|uniref:MYND-type domain-containing protein n=1 Tax=Dentipellis fragilis TaxID=205917 RepID=A0A4Y9YUC0_9AGAM|nr:hypothetical protein EVG20_g5086 [Dentipellis fragilis]
MHWSDPFHSFETYSPVLIPVEARYALPDWRFRWRQDGPRTREENKPAKPESMAHIPTFAPLWTQCGAFRCSSLQLEPYLSSNTVTFTMSGTSAIRTLKEPGTVLYANPSTTLTTSTARSTAFHDAPPVIAIRTCHNACTKWNGTDKLLRCTACGAGFYCSKECQREHRSSHKPVCKEGLECRQVLTKDMKDDRAWGDFISWIHFHRNTLLNAALASISLRDHPGADAYSVLMVEVHFSNVPGHKRFNVTTAIVLDTRHSKNAYMHFVGDAFSRRPDCVTDGRNILGADYGGVGLLIILGVFGLDLVPVPEFFHFSKASARAKPNPEWPCLFFDHLNQETKSSTRRAA